MPRRNSGPSVGWFWSALFGVLSLSSLLALRTCAAIFDRLGIGMLQSTWGTLLFLVFLFSLILGVLGCLFFILWPKWTARIPDPSGLSAWKRWLVFAAVLVVYALFNLAVWLRVPGTLIAGVWPRLALFWWAAAAGMLAVRALARKSDWPGAWLVAALVALIGVQLTVAFRWVSDFPFSLGWSEGSYIYYASLAAAKKLYGQALPLSPIYPTRALLDSLPFVVGQFPLWVHRLWSVLLTVGVSAATGILLAWRFGSGRRGSRWLFAGLSFLILMQAGVKYELQLSVILLLLLVRPGRPWISLLGVVLASFWGGLSRLNWSLVPPALAAALYFLEEPVNARGVVAYLFKGGLGVLAGIAAGIAGLAAFVQLTGGDWALLQSYGNTQSFWYRLWPSTVYAPGVLPAAILFSLPAWILLAAELRRSAGARRAIRWIGLGGVLLSLFLGGLLVSSKIGGGADLHNMDAYLVCLLIVGGALAFRGFLPEAGKPPAARSLQMPAALALLIQAAFILYGIWPFQPLNQEAAGRAVTEIQSALASVSGEGEVLFLCQRQLLAEKRITGVPLVPEYELVELTAYVNMLDYSHLDEFQDDIRTQRFRAILAYTQRDQIQGPAGYFGEENDLWVIHVSRPILCYYEPMLEFPELNLVLYVPTGEGVCTSD